MLKSLIADALSGTIDVVMVHKLDRFARNLKVLLQYFDLLVRANVGFVSISENMDFSTPWGRFALQMFGAVAELYSRNLATETAKGKRERAVIDRCILYQA